MASFFSKATQPIRMQDPTKILPPFGEEGHSPNENAGFPVTTTPHGNKSNENAEFPVTTKLHVEEEGYSANEHAGFQSQQSHMLWKCGTMLTKHYLLLTSSVVKLFEFLTYDT